MRVQPTGPVFAGSSVHTPSVRCMFGKFARRHGYAFGRRHGASVIKFCIATQLLFGRGSDWFICIQNFPRKNFRLPLSISLLFSLYFFYRETTSVLSTGQFPSRDSRKGKILSTRQKTVKNKCGKC